MNKLNQNIINNLSSEDSNQVIKVLKSLRTTGKVEYLPYIFSLYNKWDNTEIHKILTEFLSDIKDERAVPFFIEYMNNNKPVHKNVVLACWSNGLNFSNHIELFINIFFDAELETSIEAFSVIEEMSYAIGDVEKSRLLNLIQEKGSIKDSTKAAMAEGMMDFFK